MSIRIEDLRGLRIYWCSLNVIYIIFAGLKRPELADA